MSQEFSSYIGTVHSSITGSSGDYLATSISLNFESDRVALSTSNVSNYTGRVEIHDYTASYWVKNFSLSGPDGVNSSFGKEISLNWSGTRLAVSAYQKNKVYIYDATGAGSNPWASYVSNTLNTSSISLSGGAEFGYSISLAQDEGNRIAIGAPGENKVYVYEYDSVNSNWGSGPVWSIGDTGMKNLVAKTIDATSGLATAYLHAHNVSNRFGHKVRLSAFGNYLIVGAPGTVATINSSSAYDPHTSTTAYSGTTYTNQRQIGNVRCFTNDTSTWASGTIQYGQDILGKAGTPVGTDNQPAFGTSCDISTNGNKISVSSPYKKVSTLVDAGQIDTYLINDDLDTWLSVSTSIAGSKSSQKLGMNIRLDFAGERLATGDLSTSNQESAYYGGIALYAFDFGTDRWYDITPPIQVHNWPTVGSIDFNPVDITNGKIIAISDPRDPAGNSQSTAGNSGKVVFYQFPLTNAFQGNTSVGGYIKCENLYVGANDNSSNTDHLIPNKRISFGGTIKDNSYEETYIENRSVDGAGKSELLLYKRNDIWDKSGGNPHSTNASNMVDDSIRIKAAEICLDYEDTNLHGTYPNAATRNTRLRMNRGGQVAIGDSYHNNAAHILSPFDINCRSYFWTMVNIGNNTAKPVTQVPGIDTNNERLFENQGVSHSPIGGGKYGSQQFERRNISSQVWDSQEYGFYFSSSNATIYSAYHPGNWHSSSLGFACWIKLNDTPANCSGVLMWWGEDHYRAGSVFKGGYVKIVSGGLSIEYEPSSANALSVSYTFEQDTWYQIRGLVPAENAYPSLSAAITDFPAIQINGVSQTVTGPGEGGAAHASAYTSGTSWDDSSYGFGSALTYSRDSNGNITRDNSYYQNTPNVNGDHNNGVKNCWIALMSIGDGGGYAGANSHLIFPGELLTVAGTTTIGRHLGIRQNIPQYPLDVTGDINLTGDLRINGVAQSFGGGGGGGGSSLSGSNTFEWGTGVSGKEVNAGKIGYSTFSGAGYNYALDIVGAGTSSTNRNIRIYDNIGIGTSSPEAYLHVKRETSSGESNVYIQSYSDATGDREALFLGTPHGNSTTSQPKCAIIADAVGYSRANLHFCLEGTASNDSSRRASTSNSRMMIDGISGNVGIGISSPTSGKLQIQGTASKYLSYGYLNVYASTGQASGTNNYSIYANERIAGAEFNAFSDSRIKKNVVDINDSSALDKIRLLEPKIYNYIDEQQKGTSNVYGFIAQEVSNVLPYAVTVSEGDIPNILTNSNVSVTSDSNVLELRLDTTVEGLTLSNTSNINITTDNNQYLTVPVLTFSGSNVITIQNNDKFSNVTGAYIHGEHIHDFHHLNKDAIWAVSTAALQEVDRQLQAEKTKVSTLETQVVDLLARVTALENN
jgi:hypothetical protein